MGLREDNDRLRELSRAVMRGELDQGTYRAQRRRMVDVLAGDPPSDEDSFLGDPTMPGEAGASRQWPDPDRTAPGRLAVGAERPAIHSGDLWLGLAVVVGLVLAVAGLLAYFW